jgi:hypothetical protein
MYGREEVDFILYSNQGAGQLKKVSVSLQLLLGTADMILTFHAHKTSHLSMCMFH